MQKNVKLCMLEVITNDVFYTMKSNDTETINIVKCEEENDLGVIFDCKLSYTK